MAQFVCSKSSYYYYFLFIHSLTYSFILYNITIHLTGPGSMIILPNPPGTDKFLVNSSTPILAPKRPATVIKSNFNLPTRELVTEGTDINGFIIQNCILTLKSFEVANTRCGGNLCDRQGENSSRCACFQMTSRSGNVVVSIEVEITNPDGSKFSTMIQSKWFLETIFLQHHYQLAQEHPNLKILKSKILSFHQSGM